MSTRYTFQNATLIKMADIIRSKHDALTLVHIRNESNLSTIGTEWIWLIVVFNPWCGNVEILGHRKCFNIFCLKDGNGNTSGNNLTYDVRNTKKFKWEKLLSRCMTRHTNLKSLTSWQFHRRPIFDFQICWKLWSANQQFVQRHVKSPVPKPNCYTLRLGCRPLFRSLRFK